jgi:hypothetical protein
MAVVSEKDYSSLQDIREEAGHQHLNKLEALPDSLTALILIIT